MSGNMTCDAVIFVADSDGRIEVKNAATGKVVTAVKKVRISCSVQVDDDATEADIDAAEGLKGPLIVTVHGSVAQVTGCMGPLTINGSVTGGIHNTTGDITCQSLAGNITNVEGDVHVVSMVGKATGVRNLSVVNQKLTM